MNSDMPSESGKLEYTKHAVHAMAERMIPMEWVERVVAEPTLRMPDPNGPEVERFFLLSQNGTTEYCESQSTPVLHLGGW